MPDMAHRRVVLRSDYPEPIPDEGQMRFRLFYEGRFLASNGDPQSAQTDKRAPHKHEMRRVFHRQLRHFWDVNRFLKETTSTGSIMGLKPGPKRPLAEVVRDSHNSCGFNWVPLVCKEFFLTCRLDILLLRRDKPGRIMKSRDIDNRLKTLFDALKMPGSVGELGDVKPEPDEAPFFVLLQSDDLISHVSVETDELLDPPETAGKDDSFARILIDVSLHPYDVNMFNLGFA